MRPHRQGLQDHVRSGPGVNAELFPKVKVRYSTMRNRPDLSPSESMKTGQASCTGLSILLIDGCRSVGIPARLVGIPQWVNKPGNHTWVEIWDGAWHFTGACEPDKGGLDRAWFKDDAALARKNSTENAIYASSFKRTNTVFPLVWAPDVKDVFAENVTERYTGTKQPVPGGGENLPPREATNASKEVNKEPLKGALSEIQRKQVLDAARSFFDSAALPDARMDELLRRHEDEVRQVVWQAYADSKLHLDLKADFDKKRVTHDKYLSPYTVRAVGKKPATGWPLFIAMHGGGNAPKSVNDSEWVVMQRYYRDQNSVPGYLYLALRAPNDTWNGFYDDYCCPLLTNLIRQFVLFGEVNPDKVYLMGYSHGGYGAFFIGPKIPDRFAAVHASAAAPTDGTISAKSLRNTHFTFMIGENDTAYGRRERCEKFAAEIDKLRQANPGDYPVMMEFQKGFGHGGLPDRDKIKDMYPHDRNPVPRHLTWEPTDPFIKDFFWLSLDKPAKEQAIDLIIEGNKLTVQSQKVENFTVWLDRRLIDIEQPLEMIVNGKTSRMAVTPTLAALCESVQRRGDPKLAATCRIQSPVRAADSKPEADNPLYHAWPSVAGTKVQFARTTRISGGVPAAKDQVSRSTVTYKLSKVTPTELTIDVGKDVFTIPAKITPGTPGFPKLTGTEDVKIGEKTYSCKVYRYTTRSAAEAGRDTQGLPAEVTVWVTPDVPGGVVRRQISLTIKASHSIEDTWLSSSSADTKNP